MNTNNKKVFKKNSPAPSPVLEFSKKSLFNRIFLFFLLPSISLSPLIEAKPTSTSYCSQYKSFTSVDRQKISDLRFKLEKIDPNLSPVQLKATVEDILKSKMVLSLPKYLHESLQALLAELYLRVQLFKTLGLKNLSYLEFKAFIDIITYHRAMDNKGFVSEVPFYQAKQKLEGEINHYFEIKQKDIIQSTIKKLPAIQLTLKNNSKPGTADKELALKFLNLDTEKSKTLGLIEILFSQLLERNKMNREEVIAHNAMIDLSVNITTAFAGFAFAATTGIATGGMNALASTTTSAATTSLTAMALSGAAACAIGISTRYSFEQINRSYLDVSKALVRSIQNNTKLACELGYQNAEQNFMEYTKLKPVPFANDSKPLSLKDYLITCGFSAASAISPTRLGIGIDAIIAGFFINASYNLVKESYFVLKEVPNLLKLQGQAQAFNGTPQELKSLQDKVKESEAKVALYLLAMGHSTLNSFRFGLLLNMDKKNINDSIDKAKKWIASRPKNSYTPEVQTIKLILDKAKSSR